MRSLSSTKRKKLIDAVQYGKVILEDDSTLPLAMVPKEVFDVEEKLDGKRVLTRWFKYADKIFLSLYWPKAKRGLVFPFDGVSKKVIHAIIKRRALAIGNLGKKQKILVVDVLKKEPLKWMEE